MKHRVLPIVGLVVAGMAGSTSLYAITYTSDGNIADLTAGISQYATFSNFGAGDVGSPFTPTSSELAADGFRVYDGGSVTGLPTDNNWIVATFGSAESAIRVFPNIDHYGTAYDGYQYMIYGSVNGTTWTPLFDTTGVNGSGEPFTLGTFTGTAPTKVNNVLTPGAGPGGTVGYEADFDFGTGYTEYAFGASTYATQSGNADQELSAVGAFTPNTGVPDGTPGGSFALLLAGLGTLALFGRVLPSAKLARAN